MARPTMLFTISLHTVLLCSAVAHLMATAVTALFARHKMDLLALPWVMGLFGTALFITLPFHETIEAANPGLLHPAMLMALLMTTFLQTIYPLGISMPGFLQWGRMWRYAVPVIVLLVLYLGGLAFGLSPVHMEHWSELPDHLANIDIWLRFAILCVSLYYIVNILRLPRLLLRSADIPHYLIGYSTALGLGSCLYVYQAIDFDVSVFKLWITVFTLTNLYMTFRVLETLALSLPKPSIHVVGEEPAPAEIEKAAREDFNEANQRRFEHVEFWMQHHRDAWKDYTFSRDVLCDATGVNRHLLLQSLRSQGFNNAHDYINTYRITELKRMIDDGEVRSVRDCLSAGFGTIKTARSSFEKIVGKSLDDYLSSI